MRRLLPCGARAADSPHSNNCRRFTFCPNSADRTEAYAEGRRATNPLRWLPARRRRMVVRQSTSSSTYSQHLDASSGLLSTVPSPPFFRNSPPGQSLPVEAPALSRTSALTPRGFALGWLWLAPSQHLLQLPSSYLPVNQIRQNLPLFLNGG